jgi:hypothetical protein
MSSDRPDRWLDALRAVPLRGPSREVDERVLAAGRKAFLRSRPGTGDTLLRALVRVRVPAILAGTAAVYLACALQTAGALYR